MGSKIRAMLRLHYLDTRPSFTIFWSILIGIFVLSCILLYRFDDGSVMMSGWFAVYIYVIIGGAITVNGTMPVALGWGVMRRDYCVATLIHYVLVAALLSIVCTLMLGVEKWFISFSGVRFQFFNFSLLTDKGVAFILWFHFIITLTLIASAHVVGSLYYRFGKLGVFMLFAGNLLFLVVIRKFDLITPLIRFLDKIETVENFSLFLVPWVFVCFVAGWLVLRKAPAKKAW